MNVSKSTRASKNGKLIICPQCNNEARVYHFAWSAITCINCGADVNKLDWRLLWQLIHNGHKVMHLK